MLYREVLLYYLVPPILGLLLAYGPLIGRRDGIKIIWLALMATLWTTPWDNWIISQSGWQYPPNSILGRIWLVPLEEHAFFILQPIFLILLHSLCTHHRLLPFDHTLSPSSPGLIRSSSRLRLDGASPRGKTAESPTIKRNWSRTSLSSMDGSPTSPKWEPSLRTLARRSLQTMPRRPRPSLVWLTGFLTGLVLVLDAHGVLGRYSALGLDMGKRAFYLGWILVWISPIIGSLTWLGARLTRSGWTAWTVGSFYLCMVDTIGIRSGAWSISPDTTIGINIVPGLPLEEFTFFLLTSYLIVLSCSLIDHLHALLILTPSLPPCPPSNPLSHIMLLARVSLNPPPIDVNILSGLRNAEETLKKGSKSFSIAKLAFSREMRLGLVAMYSWCRVTDNLIDDPVPSSPAQSDDTLHQTRLHILESIRKHLRATYATPYPASNSACDGILDTIPNLSQSTRSAFRLFSAIVPRLVPIDPFLELCDGYETDTHFAPISSLSPSSTTSDAGPSVSSTPIKTKLLNDHSLDLDRHFPIKTSHDLMEYADDVAGSIAAAICYLSWSILDTPYSPSCSLTPVQEHLLWSHRIHTRPDPPTRIPTSDIFSKRVWVVQKSREMGRALQLVNISRDIAKDAATGRVYVPLSSFPSASALLDILLPSSSRPPTYAPYSLPLLNTADDMRKSSEAAIGSLPRTARGGTRAMVASYFEIGTAIRDNDGEVDQRGVKVSKWKRAGQAARAIWVGSW